MANVSIAWDKTADLTVTIGKNKTTTTATTLQQLLSYELVPPIVNGLGTALPDGVKFIVWQPPLLIVVQQQPAALRQLRWLAADSPAPYGPDATYRPVVLSLPYVLTFVAFTYLNKQLAIAPHHELYFLNQPVKTLHDKLCFPALLNISKVRHPTATTDHTWVCTQYLRADHNQSWLDQLELLLNHIWHGGFNLSSEYHEGSSWYTESAKVIPSITPIENWQQQSQQDASMALRTKWLSAPFTVQDVINRLQNMYDVLPFTKVALPQRLVNFVNQEDEE